MKRRKISVIFLIIHLVAICTLLPACKPESIHPTPLPGVSAHTLVPSPEPPNTPAARELELVEDTGHFTIRYTGEDQASASFLGIVLEENLQRVCSDLGQCPVEKIEVLVYPNQKWFHEAIGYPDAPDWVVGMGINGKIQMVSPRLLSSDLVDHGVVHELTHVLQGMINSEAPIWMSEGIAMYEAGMSESVQEVIGRSIQGDAVPTLASLNQDSEAVALADGYAYSYTVIDFVVQRYGKDILAKWVKTPHDYELDLVSQSRNLRKRGSATCWKLTSRSAA